MVTQHSREGASAVRSAIRQSTEMVREYPFSSLLVVYGAGVGLGVLLSQTVCDPMIRAMSHEPTMMERLGRQMYDAFHNVMPESLSRRMSA